MSLNTEASTPGFLVWRLSMKWRMAVDRALAPLGLTHARYSLLASLLSMEQSGEQPSQSQLAESTGLEPLYISRLARALEDDGLVQRDPHPADSRAVQLSMTDSGRETIASAVDNVHVLLDELLAPLGGLGAERTEVFTRQVAILLDVPLRPPT
ncbi:MAG TPA: MarR family transcriptional regulator [Acidimicrobiales bacterium]|jgi:DNA-binding MarR family transcriptional regulator|nr:MarR family transcriptional regulator [Acidimicrobiales bacterium]